MEFRHCRRFFAFIVSIFFVAVSLGAIDIQALSDEQAKSMALAAQLVAVSNEMLEKAIDRGGTYQQVKELNNIYQESQNIKRVLSSNSSNGDNDGLQKKGKIEAAFKKAIKAPVDLDKAIKLTGALQKKIKEAPRDAVDLTPLAAILSQLEASLQTALDLKSQWLNTRKAN